MMIKAFCRAIFLRRAATAGSGSPGSGRAGLSARAGTRPVGRPVMTACVMEGRARSSAWSPSSTSPCCPVLRRTASSIPASISASCWLSRAASSSRRLRSSMRSGWSAGGATRPRRPLMLWAESEPCAAPTETVVTVSYPTGSAAMPRWSARRRPAGFAPC